jgi:integrase
VKTLTKYDGKLKQKRILPYFNNVILNKKIKELMEAAGFTEIVVKTRRKRGVPRKNSKNTKTQYRFCDLITTHTMRRTAITTMLSLGMKEQMVRKISGHAPNSKEFYRYVNFAQNYLDNELDLVQTRLKERQLDLSETTQES